MMALPLLAEWLEQNLHRPVTLSLLAKKVGCSSRHLSDLFSKTFGISIGAYIQKRRLTLASTMLRTTRRDITDIALMYQYSHLSSFSRAFRKQFGQSPQHYREAGYWDMTRFYPSVAVTSFASHTDIIGIPENTGIVPLNNRKKGIHFGLDFIINTENGKITSDQKIHQDIIEIIFHKNAVYPLVVYGTVLPGKECDTDVDIVLGTFTPDGDKKGRVNIPAGHYACFAFRGTPVSIMQFHSWAKGHGMHMYHLVMKKGPTFSVFEKTSTRGIYKTEYYIPCRAENTMSARL
ncbi:AraC family transcriptional regulator [Salmonella enterica]|nr:AraC family transcriptional regulator [Salmonella enterica]EEO7819497.1 AraC family transcriptional regulator [Salmonella enterica]EEO8057712.1 AraC family transcriptional regulator [Salmonella enterica]EEP0049379.1 AraC family transcriptional regulator [Salmonella enterica]